MLVVTLRTDTTPWYIVTRYREIRKEIRVRLGLVNVLDLANTRDSCLPTRYEPEVVWAVQSSFIQAGGPGGGCDERARAFFNPEKYKAGSTYFHVRSLDLTFTQVIFLDQRGAGKSTPWVSKAGYLAPLTRLF